MIPLTPLSRRVAPALRLCSAAVAQPPNAAKPGAVLKPAAAQAPVVAQAEGADDLNKKQNNPTPPLALSSTSIQSGWGSSEPQHGVQAPRADMYTRHCPAIALDSCASSRRGAQVLAWKGGDGLMLHLAGLTAAARRTIPVLTSLSSAKASSAKTKDPAKTGIGGGVEALIGALVGRAEAPVPGRSWTPAPESPRCSPQKPRRLPYRPRRY